MVGQETTCNYIANICCNVFVAGLSYIMVLIAMVAAFFFFASGWEKSYIRLFTPFFLSQSSDASVALLTFEYIPFPRTLLPRGDGHLLIGGQSS